jgi:hypothetical protein
VDGRDKPGHDEVHDSIRPKHALDTIFQGARFRTMARDYQPSFDAIFQLADDHASSRQSTAWRFVEEQDEPVALLQYYPSNAIDEYGNCVLVVWRSVGSPAFTKRFGEIDLPSILRTGHPWVAARDISTTCDGNETLLVDGDSVSFQRQSWWNGYTLFVLLRHKPRLSIVGDFLRPS